MLVEAKDIKESLIEEKLTKLGISNKDNAAVMVLDSFGRKERHLDILIFLTMSLHKVSLIKKKDKYSNFYRIFLVGEKENVQNGISYYRTITEQMKKDLKIYLDTMKERDHKKTMRIRHAFFIGFLQALDNKRQGDVEEKTCSVYFNELVNKKDIDVVYLKKGLIAGFTYYNKK